MLFGAQSNHPDGTTTMPERILHICVSSMSWSLTQNQGQVYHLLVDSVTQQNLSKVIPALLITIEGKISPPKMEVNSSNMGVGFWGQTQNFLSWNDGLS